jgi:uncharacterized membrane protein (UPF0127 family)
VKLISKKTQQTLCHQIQVADDFKSRLMGLIGTKELKEQGLFIPRCNWVHTFFMSMAIDVIYLDKKGKIKKIDSHLKPWKLPLPVFSATDVVELPAGFTEQKKMQIGDTVYVGH